MAEKTISARLLVRSDTSANWSSVNPTLHNNELAFDTTTKKFKIGDGSTAWNSLDYIEGVEIDTTSLTRSQVHYIEGTGTSAGVWLGTDSSITEYYTGLIVLYKIPIDGKSGGVTLQINSLGAKKCYYNATSSLTTHFPKGCVVLLVYDETLNSNAGGFRAEAQYAGNDVYVRQYYTATTVENTYPLLFRHTTTSTTSYVNAYARFANELTYNASTGVLSSPKFSGDLIGNADTATKATQDGNGNVITETYATKEELENATLGGGSSEQQWTPKEGYNLLHDVEYIYVSPETSKNIDVTIGEGINATDGYWFSIYWDSSTNKKYFRMITNDDLVETQFELASEENNIYSVIMGAITGAPITMMNNDYVYFVEGSSSKDYYTQEETDTLLNDKVDKVSGKGLSTNDFTTALKNKLDGIASGAEVNVQSDWNATSGDAFIKNKPTIPTKVTDLSDASNYATKQDLEGLGGGSSGGTSTFDEPESLLAFKNTQFKCAIVRPNENRELEIRFPFTERIETAIANGKCYLMLYKYSKKKYWQNEETGEYRDSYTKWTTPNDGKLGFGTKTFRNSFNDGNYLQNDEENHCAFTKVQLTNINDYLDENGDFKVNYDLGHLARVMTYESSDGAGIFVSSGWQEITHEDSFIIGENDQPVRIIGINMKNSRYALKYKFALRIYNDDGTYYESNFTNVISIVYTRAMKTDEYGEAYEGLLVGMQIQN